MPASRAPRLANFSTSYGASTGAPGAVWASGVLHPRTETLHNQFLPSRIPKQFWDLSQLALILPRSFAVLSYAESIQDLLQSSWEVPARLSPGEAQGLTPFSVYSLGVTNVVIPVRLGAGAEKK